MVSQIKRKNQIKATSSRLRVKNSNLDEMKKGKPKDQKNNQKSGEISERILDMKRQARKDSDRMEKQLKRNIDTFEATLLTRVQTSKREIKGPINDTVGHLVTETKSTNELNDQLNSITENLFYHREAMLTIKRDMDAKLKKFCKEQIIHLQRALDNESLDLSRTNIHTQIGQEN